MSMQMMLDDFHSRKDFRGLQISARWDLAKDSLSKYIICVLNERLEWTQHTSEEYANKEEPIAIIKMININRKNLGLNEIPMKVIKVTVSTEIVE
jgi:hypothetical protein